jgi:two-component system, cell cycle sensor histidine kinase and response regulator CckA
MLKGLGVQSETAGSGREGIEAFEREPDAYDVVILDMNMNELDGVAVLAHLLERRAEQRVLFTSGDVRERVPDTYRRLGNVGFLRKPFLQKDLICEVSALVHGPSLFGP